MQQNREVRSIDIARHLELSKPSVSRAMSLLKEGGYIKMHKDGFIDFTDDGIAIAKQIYERHRLISSWLISIGVSEKVAAEDACRIEHDISEETFQRLKQHFNSDS